MPSGVPPSGVTVVSGENPEPLASVCDADPVPVCCCDADGVPDDGFFTSELSVLPVEPLPEPAVLCVPELSLVVVLSDELDLFVVESFVVLLCDEDVEVLLFELLPFSVTVDDAPDVLYLSSFELSEST